MKSNKSLTLKIAAAYIGTVVGAGFASGQEIMQFFTVYGTVGIYTLAASGVLFMWAGYAVFNVSLRLNAHNYKDFIFKLCGKELGFFYDLLITIFLFIGTAIMFSGGGALFKENLQLPSFVGVLVMAALTLIVVWQSLNGVLRVNAVVVPLLISAVLSILLLTLRHHDVGLLLVNIPDSHPNMTLKAVFSMLFYCSYNLMFSIGVLSAFTDEIKTSTILRQSAILGGLGLLLIASCLNICLLFNVPLVFHYSIPMLFVVGQYGPWVRALLILAVWCEIFTTAVSNLFSLSSRLSEKKPSFYKLSSLLLVAACIPLSLINFKWLVSICYPLFGALSLFLFLSVLRFSFTKA